MGRIIDRSRLTATDTNRKLREVAMPMESNLFLQPLWEYITRHWSHVASYWLFPAIVGWVAFVTTGLYFTMKDIGPWQSYATRLSKNHAISGKEILRVGGIQVGVYGVLNIILWFVYPYHVQLPQNAPSLWELSRDLVTSLLIGDLLVYVEHLAHHKIPVLYKNVHKVHHRFKFDLFSWAAGWVHPFELTVFASCMIVYPMFASPVHPLTLWIYEWIFVALLLEEHSGHDVWWSPHHLIPDIFGGAVPHILHHTKVSTNYGFLFTIWDRMFGTYMAP